jgi:hypothetical protein
VSLWTPSGEHEVPRDRPGAATQAPSGDDWRERLVNGEIGLDDLSPEQRAEVEEAVNEMAQTQRQLLATPIEQLITQHIIGLRELAILHLQQPQPNYAAAQAAIDAIAGIVESVGPRLGELHEPLRQDVQQLQLAFVQRAEQDDAPDAPDGA